MKWRTVLGLAMGPAVALGLGRFAYGLVLPAMRDDLGWSYGRAGVINGANAVGYLVGALLAAPLLARVGPRRGFMGGITITALVVLASAATGWFGVLLVLRTLAGVSGAVTFIAGAALVAGLGGDGRLLFVYLSGAAIGVALSGVVVPAVLDAFDWQVGWVALGGLCLVGAGLAERASRRAAAPPPRPTGDGAWSARPILPVLVSYTLYGAGYIAYMTFIVAFLRHEGHGTVMISAFWFVLGLTATMCAPRWGRVADALQGGRTLALSTAVVTVGAVLPLLSGSSPVAFGSAVVFGGAFLAVPAAATAFARRYHEPHHWTIAISALTVGFAFGQCLGPVLAGVLSDGPSGIRAGLTLSAVILAVAAAAALPQS